MERRGGPCDGVCLRLMIKCNNTGLGISSAHPDTDITPTTPDLPLSPPVALHKEKDERAREKRPRCASERVGQMALVSVRYSWTDCRSPPAGRQSTEANHHRR